MSDASDEAIEGFLEAVEALRETHPRVTFGLESDDGRVLLSWLEVDPPGHGHGSAFMRDVERLADEHEIALEVDPESGDDPLVAFYAKFGFAEINADRMTRFPVEKPKPT